MIKSFLSLILIQQPSILNGIIINEVYDVNVLDKLINSNLLKEKIKNPYVKYENEKIQLIKYKELYNGYYSTVKLNRKINIPYGRCNPNSCLSLFSIRKEIRHTLCYYDYYDFDIVNCHPEILYQICINNNIDCIYLENYVKNRSYYLNLISDTYNVTKDDAKKLFIRLLYGGCFENWASELNLKDSKPIEFINNFIDNFTNISNIIYNNNNNLFELIKNDKLNNNKSITNLKGSVTSYFLQEIEVRVLEILYKYCVNKDYIINNECVLAADGIMLLKKNIKKPLENICDEFNKIIYEKTGLNLTIINKPFDFNLNNILDDNINFYLPLKDFSSGLLADYFKMMYSNIFLYNNNTLYYYNGYYWIDEDKKSKLHNFIDDIFYKHLSKKVCKLIEEHKINNKEDKKDQYLEKLLLFQKNILNLRKCRYRNEFIDDICYKLTNNNIKFDENPNIFVFNNKVYDLLLDGFIEPYHKQYIKTTCGYDYDNYYSNDKIIELDNLLDTILPDVHLKNFYLTILATGLYGELVEKIVIAQGGGGNGKSLLNELMLETVGNYGYKLPSIVLLQELKTGGNPQLALLHNKRFVLSQEPNSSRRYCTSTLKELTGGSKLNSRKLHSNDCDVSLKLTFINECNKLPLLDEVNDAVIRRLSIIPFISKFVDDHEYENIVDKTNIFVKNVFYKTQEFKNKYKQALFEILRKYFNLYKNNNFNLIQPPILCYNLTKDYLACSDDIYEWFSTIFEKEDNETSAISIISIYNIFISSQLYENMSKSDKRKFSLKYFNENIKNNTHLKNYYKPRDTYFNKIRYRHPIIIGFKQKDFNEIPNITNNLDEFIKE